MEEVNEVCWVYITFYYSCLNVYPECKTEEKLVVDCVKKVDCRKWIDPEIVLGLNNKKML